MLGYFLSQLRHLALSSELNKSIAFTSFPQPELVLNLFMEIASIETLNFHNLSRNELNAEAGLAFFGKQLLASMKIS
jgi:hypothetical protein